MFECVFVPNSVHIKDEHLLRFHISEDHVGVEHVHRPEHLAGYDVSVNSFKVIDVNCDAADISEQISFVEYDLFSVGQQLCVECEIFHYRYFTWKRQ